jgi:hypothetical protein
MAYSIQLTNGTTITTVADGTVDNSTDLKLIGKNFAGYGEIQNENFVFLLENFASANPPSRPLRGQIWYDSGLNKLKFYDGEDFKTAGGTEATPTAPIGLATGDMWFDTGNNKLYVYNGTDFSFIGPQDAGTGVTRNESVEIIGIDQVTYPVVTTTVDNEIIAIYSAYTFEIANTGTQFSDYTNFVGSGRKIYKGITLAGISGSAGTNGAGISTDTLLHGTATDSNKLGGFDAADYVRSGAADFTATVKFGNQVVFGANDALDLSIDNTIIDFRATQVGSEIKFSIYDGVEYQNVARLSLQADNPAIVPGFTTSAGDEGDRDLGASDNPWNSVYATSFKGEADRTSEMAAGSNSNFTSGTYVKADYENVANTIPIRNASGIVKATEFSGIATSAKYADLAEIYKSENNDIPPGTIVAITGGPGDTEIGPAFINGLPPIGVISTNPAFLMNSEATGQPVALTGRVPMFVKGIAGMGSPVYLSDEPGVGTTTQPQGTASRIIVGYALVEKDLNEEKRLVEVFVKC